MLDLARCGDERGNVRVGDELANRWSIAKEVRFKCHNQRLEWHELAEGL